MPLLPDYPNPVVLCSTTGTGLQPDILDIGAMLTPEYPPVLQVFISATATVVINGALQVAQTNPATMVNAIDVSAGGFTTSDFYDIIPGIRFYQANVTANTGTVVVKCGVGPQLPGSAGLPQLLRYTNNAPQGT
jgi:hypothetical protein